jgi:hypothetical protein
LTLVPDPSAPKALKEASQAHTEKSGNGYVVPLVNRDSETGTFKQGVLQGQVSGLELTFTWGSNNGTLSLQNDNALSGVVRLGRTQFIGTALLR